MNHIQEVAARLRGLRDALELTAEEMAHQCDVSPEELAAYESGEYDVPVSFLHRLASAYGVELTALLFGEEPTMNSYFVTRAGKGVKVERTEAYSYQDLAAGFQRRIMAPFLVTIEPTDSPLTLNVHSGQEFNYVLEGEIELSVGGHVTRMRPGDSIMFDSLRPHGLRAIGSTARIIAIIS
ncbi:helix-turn-helix domain-containing protein [Muribaculum intestinale]|uniref:helix-turn-helix domain-containing protein n=1 Tax=Muribaculum intestinale TaxID=1796646 RepID=UPI0025A9DCB1|nr:XRE family transcriptional regulator [Muribaculum intestinale]